VNVGHILHPLLPLVFVASVPVFDLLEDRRQAAEWLEDFVIAIQPLSVSVDMYVAVFLRPDFREDLPVPGRNGDPPPP
jgi:hypothetical protein